MTDKQINKLRPLVQGRNLGKDLSIDEAQVHTNLDMATLETEILPAINKLIDMCGGDSESAGQVETAFRVVKAWYEQTTGYDDDPTRHLKVQFTKAQSDDIIIVKDIKFNSVCEHHIMPFFGSIHIGYIPGDKVIGISKIPRMAKEYGRTMQLQERLGDQIVDAMMEVAGAKGAIVIIDGAHTCMTTRGVTEPDATTITLHTRGIFRDNSKLEDKFLAAIR